MPLGETTCWTLITAAGRGDTAAREDFARRYLLPVRAYLAVRWRGNSYSAEIDDATQEVFVECLRDGGALEKANPELQGGFRAFLYGVVRNVALRHEQCRARSQARRQKDLIDLDERAADEASLSKVFDREWAKGVLREAVDLHATRARADGPEAQRRFELLRLRFHDGLPIREIAQLWQEDPARLYTDYARARREFKVALHEIVAGYHGGGPEVIATECARLRELLE